MFRCYFCQQVTPPKTTKHNVIISIREKEYPTRRKESKGGRRFRSRDDVIQDRGGKGREIAKEVAACPACAAKHQNEEATIVESEVTTETPVEGGGEE